MPKPSTDPRLDGLLDLARREGVDIRPTLLRVITDLYVQKPFHTFEEEAQFVELATGLIEAVDPGTRAIVAGTLRDYPATPAAVWCKLAATESPVAREDDLCELFFSATPEERRLILANLIADETTRGPHVSADVLMRLEASALQRNPSAFTRILRAALAVAPQLALRIVQDASGEPLVVALRALGMPPAATQRILLFLDPLIGQSAGRVYELAKVFDELSPAAAVQMVSIWRAAAPARRAASEPASFDDDKRSARSFADSAPRRVQSTITSPARSSERKR